MIVELPAQPHIGLVFIARVIIVLQLCTQGQLQAFGKGDGVLRKNIALRRVLVGRQKSHRGRIGHLVLRGTVAAAPHQIIAACRVVLL